MTNWKRCFGDGTRNSGYRHDHRNPSARPLDPDFLTLSPPTCSPSIMSQQKAWNSATPIPSRTILCKTETHCAWCADRRLKVDLVWPGNSKAFCLALSYCL